MIAADAPPLVLVGGAAAESDGHGSDLWLAALDEDGCTRWVDLDGEHGRLNNDDEVLGVGGSPEGYWAVGVIDMIEDSLVGGDVWIRRYTIDGEIAWTRRELATWPYPQIASAVAVDRNGNAVIVGGGWTPEGRRGWLRRFTPDGDGIGEAMWLSPGPESHILDVAIAPTGRSWISFWIEEWNGFNNTWLGEVRESALLWMEPNTDPHAEAARLALAQGDRPVFIETGASYAPEIRVSLWSGEGMLQWVSAGLGYSRLRVLRGAVTDSGEVLLAGAPSSIAGPGEPRLLRLAPDGAVISLQAIPGIPSGSASDVAIAPDGSVYLTGLIDDECDVWVAKVSSR